MLTVDKVEKSFGDNNVLKGISFSVNKGQIFGLIGKNGVGKTTLINIIAGLSSADSGTCRIDDQVITVSNKSLSIGYLPDSPNFFEYLTCGEYLDFLLMENHSERRKKLLDLVELMPDTKISTMSRGMRQRLGIAAAIIGDPDIVLLDEPTSALDPSGRADVARILVDLKGMGKTIILSTHILTDMEKVCDSVGFLSDGIIAKALDIKELDKGGKHIFVSIDGNMVNELFFNKEDIPYEIMKDGTFRFDLGEDHNLEKQQALFKSLSGLNVRIDSIHSEVGTLDKIFQEVCR